MCAILVLAGASAIAAVVLVLLAISSPVYDNDEDCLRYDIPPRHKHRAPGKKFKRHAASKPDGKDADAADVTDRTRP